MKKIIHIVLAIACFCSFAEAAAYNDIFSHTKQYYYPYKENLKWNTYFMFYAFEALKASSTECYNSFEKKEYCNVAISGYTWENGWKKTQDTELYKKKHNFWSQRSYFNDVWLLNGSAEFYCFHTNKFQYYFSRDPQRVTFGSFCESTIGTSRSNIQERSLGDVAAAAIPKNQASFHIPDFQHTSNKTEEIYNGSVTLSQGSKYNRIKNLNISGEVNIYIEPGEYFFDNLTITDASIILKEPGKQVIIHVKNDATFTRLKYPSATSKSSQKNYARGILLINHNDENVYKFYSNSNYATKINGSDFYGTIFAPYSNVQSTAYKITGSIIAKDIEITNGAHIFVPYNPD